MTRPFSPPEQAALQQAVALHQSGRFDQALAVYRQLLAIQPDNAEVLRLAGTALAMAQRFAEGEPFLRRSLALQANPDTTHCLGNALQGLGRFEEAVACYNQVLAVRPNDPDALNARGNAFQDLKRYAEAFADYDQALALRPGHLDAMLNRGLALQALNRLDEAMTAFDEVLATDPNDAETLHHRGNLLFLFGRFEAALDDYRRALRIKPDIDWLPGHALYMQMYLSDWSGFQQGRNWLEQKIRGGARVTAPLPVQAVIDDPAIQRRASELFAPKATAARLPAYKGHDRIRVGYFSSDFKNHPVSHLLAGVLERHNRAKVEVFAFSLREQGEDEWRTRVREAADHFIQLAELSDADAIAAVRALEIDIAVDLNGYTFGGRTELFTGRVAPVQVGYLGFLGTMGGDFTDYLLADEIIIPESHKRFYTEKVAWLPSFQVNDDRQKPSDRVFTRAEIGLPETGFVFCSFNQNYKITPDVYDCWMRILTQVPGSVLWLHVKEPAAILNLKAEARGRGIDPDRIVLAEMLALGDHLARLPLADLFLDSHPYNAGATASNALRMGLPVLTRIGQSFAARMGASLLTAVGLPELITETPEAYEALAVKLATQPGELAAIKAKLKANLAGSLLFDTDRAARALESVYAGMVRDAPAGT
jgi:predicted O-linked N-acetylglucosamine transferase (SPINDLY family)